MISKLDNLARKARRRGDAAEAVLWYRALALRQTAEERAHLAAERRWTFNNDSKKLERMQEELERLRRYAAWHPQQIERAKAAEAAEKDASGGA
ncbi:MAG TPA: hypothetical protein VGO52_27480 [Hyphomonadaceae bacterium]|jgi:hypothetical protein|nr:hypothetical protein [Hyphomonadaceae bacterium]